MSVCIVYVKVGEISTYKIFPSLTEVFISVDTEERFPKVMLRKRESPLQGFGYDNVVYPSEKRCKTSSFFLLPSSFLPLTFDLINDIILNGQTIEK
ncbi:hypothetical protein [Dapis sp. BLCC M172]|uniref:hypothetical protein n=1 Tax=Dapis sp. BLCC M172 TaxID=2975281 RepID=UPI003CFB105B